MFVSFEGLDEFQQRLMQIQARRENPLELMEDILQEMSQSINLTFNLEGRPERWTDRTTGGDWPILHKTGHLHNATISTLPGDDSIAGVEIGAQESLAEIGTYVYYGKYHQHPDHLAHLDQGIMPIRRFLLFFPNELVSWCEKIRQFLWWGRL